MSEFRTVVADLSFPEGPRWHRGRHCSPWSVAAIESHLRLDSDRSFGESVGHADTLMRAPFQGADLAEAVASFSERRPPTFAPLSPSRPTHKEI